MGSLKAGFANILRLRKKVTEWGVVKNLTSDKTDALRDKSLFWGGILLLIELSDAKAKQLFFLEFEPRLSTEVLSTVVLILSVYYFFHWLKSIQGDVISFEIEQLSDPIVELGTKLDETKNRWSGLAKHFDVMEDTSHETQQLRGVFDDIENKHKQLRRMSSYRNLLFWLTDLIPVPVLLSYNLYLFLME